MVGFGAFLTLTDAGGRNHRDVYRDALETAEIAEHIGCDSVWINEHHFMGFSICPDTLTMAAALLARTKSIRVGNAVSLIPTQHPISIAERASQLDNLSGGRFDLGLGRGGYPLDSLVFGMPTANLARCLDDGIPIIHRALTGEYTGGAASLWPFPSVRISPRPFTKPHLPILVAGQSDTTMAIAASRGLGLLLSWHQTHAEREAVVRRYDDALTAAAWAGPRPTHVGSAVAFIGESREAARAELQPHFRAWLASGASGTFDPNAEGAFAGAIDELKVFASKNAARLDASVERLLNNNPVGTVDDVAAWFREDMVRTGTRRYAVFFDIIPDRTRALLNLKQLLTQIAPALS